MMGLVNSPFNVHTLIKEPNTPEVPEEEEGVRLPNYSDSDIETIRTFAEKFLSANPRKPVLQVIIIPLAATTKGIEIKLPAVFQYVAFYFDTAPASPISIGPNSPDLPVSKARIVIFPGTTQIFRADNPGAAYTLYAVCTNDLPPFWAGTLT